MDAKISSGYVTGGLGYLIPSRNKPVNYMFQPPEGTPRQNCDYEQRYCAIRDARLVASSLTLESNGFELLDAPSGVSNFYEEKQITDIYYREIENICKDIIGGIRAVVFDHVLRIREPDRPTSSFGREGDGSKPAALGRVHNDYTEASGHRRLNLLMPDMVADHPFVILNTWRPILNPALDTPLAVCDARSFPSKDWVAGDIIYPTRTGEISLGTYSDSHKWYYYPAMMPTELLVFKSYDSRLDSPTRMTAHCAFDDPTAPADAPPRRSIETRCLVVLE